MASLGEIRWRELRVAGDHPELKSVWCAWSALLGRLVGQSATLKDVFMKRAWRCTCTLENTLGLGCPSRI